MAKALRLDYCIALFIILVPLSLLGWRHAEVLFWYKYGSSIPVTALIVDITASPHTAASTRYCDLGFSYSVNEELYVSYTYGVGFSLKPKECNERFDIGQEISAYYIQEQPDVAYVEAKESTAYLWVYGFLVLSTFSLFILLIISIFWRKAKKE